VTKNVLLLDTLNSMFNLYHCNESDPVWRFIADIKNIVRDWKIHKVVLACDRGQSAFRLAMYPQYKEARRARRELATPAEKEALSKFFKQVDEFIKLAPLFGFEVVGVGGCEADDIISYLATTKGDNYRAAILSSDTDLFQLLRPGVMQRAYGPKMKLLDVELPQNVWVTEPRFKEVYQITPQQFVEYKALAGDTSDSIYSPEGMGPGTALKLIRKYGSISEIEKNVDNLDIPRFSEKARANLKENFHLVHRNVPLVNLLHDAETYNKILGEGIDMLEDIKARIDEPPVLDDKKVKEMLFERGKVNIYNSYDEWTAPFRGR